MSRTVLIYPGHGEITMTSNKPAHIKDEIWNQHLKWLDLVSNECKSNQLKQKREKRRRGSAPGVGADLS